MSVTRCAYQDCNNCSRPCSRQTFFSLPKDQRRDVWIKNSGNPKLKDLPMNSSRLFCEDHFHESDKRSQFMRTTLSKTACPIPYNKEDQSDNQGSCSEKKSDQTDNVLIIETGDLCICSSEGYIETSDHSEECKLIPETPQHTASQMNLLSNQYDKIRADANRRRLENLEDGSTESATFERIEKISYSYDNIDYLSPKPSSRVYTYKRRLSHSMELNEKPSIKLKNGLIESRIESPTAPKLVKKVVLKSQKVAPLSKEDKKTLQILKAADEAERQDRHFALSLVGYFLELPKQTKAIAKLKILKYLTDLQTGKYDATI